VTLTIDPAEAPAAAAALTSDILPRITSAPGFVAGYWLEPRDGQGFSMVVFEAEDQAHASLPPTTSWAAPRVTIQSGADHRTGVTCDRLGNPARIPSRTQVFGNYP
jgi:hypothetical protein